ncbi:MAG: hypothetical protein HQL50_14430 [Magnetococcales bacterium]|nr:hypothetical protein [Magnetococcales bacterium]
MKRHHAEHRPSYSAEQRSRDYAITFGSEEGQRVLKDLIRQTSMMEPVFSDDHTSLQTAAFRDGMRNVTLLILNQLGTDTDALQTLMTEADNHE